MMKKYKVKNNDFYRMEKYGFVFVIDPDIKMILRHDKGNVYIELNGFILTFHEELLEEAIQNGDVIEEGV